MRGWDSRRLRPTSAGAVVLALVAGLLAATPARGSDPGPGYTTDCPAPESLVVGTHWQAHRLAPGVVLREARRSDASGYVKMHVLTADVTNPELSFRPLVRKIAMRQRLSSFGTNRRLVAATNAGYFDWTTGAPIGPAVYRGRPLLMTSTSTTVVGFAADGLLQSGQLQSGGTIATPYATQPLAGLNSARPGRGFTAYNARWGRTHVIVPRDSVSRYVKHGVIVSGSRRYNRAPAHGFLVVARGAIADAQLRSVRRGTQIFLRLRTTTDAPRPFRQAYAVGSQIVAPGGIAQRGLSCRRSYPRPARTGIGFSDGGRRLFLVAVDDRPGTSLNGLDSVQLGRVMADLGADQAYLFDGGGSTTMLARMHRSARQLSMRNQGADGYERAVPLGFGIFRR